MLSVDVFAGYTICGASSLIGAGVMMMATRSRLARPHTTRALKLCISAFLVIGTGTIQFAAFNSGPPPWSILWAAESAVIGTALFGWGFVRFGERRLPPSGLRALLFTLAALLVCAQLISDRYLAISMDSCCFLVAAATLIYGFENLFVPHNLAQKSLFVSFSLYAVTWIGALVAAVASRGEPPPHLLYVAEPLLSIYAIFYGVIPILLASLVLNHVNEELGRLLNLKAVTDELTGVVTRRGLYENAPAIRDRAAHEGATTAVIMLDIDHFKRINDSHGHAAGDEVLQQAARLLESGLRKGSLLARYGGEEFVAVFSVPDPRAARQAAERLRQTVENKPLQLGHSRPSLTVTLSAGLATWARDEDLAAALKRADVALYSAKASGRNRVEYDVAVA